MPSPSSMPAIASLSASVKSTPLVCAPSRSVVSNKYRRSLVMSDSGQTVNDIESDQHGRGEHPIFEHDVIEPMAWERRVGFGHEASRLAASCLCNVVLASHSSPVITVLRCWAI